MFTNLKTSIASIHKSLLPNELAQDKRKKNLFYISFYCIFASTFLTVFSQLPMFTSRGITQLFQIGWIITFIPILMLDYKQILRYLALSILIVLPFILYCLIALIFGIQSFQYGGTTYVLLCLFLLIVFGSFSKYKTKNTTKIICFSFLLSSILYAGVVFLTKLIGYDLSNQIYAFGDKNSAGPIFMCAAIIAFYLFDKRNVSHTIAKWTIFAFFVVIIALSKTRSVLITIPIILFIFLFKDIKNNIISLITLLAFITSIILIFVIPFLRETIVINILLNGKTDIDSIFSGRLTQIVTNLQNFKPILGTGGSYFDCMILSLLCSYGVFGFASLLPFIIFPFYILFVFKKKCGNSSLKTILIALIIVFLASSFLEGYGYIGTGAKVFIFWFFVGSYSFDVYHQFKENPVNKPTKKLNSIINKIPKKTVTFSIKLLLIMASTVMITITNVPYTIGKAVIDKLPSSNAVANYVEVKDIQIDPPVESMCVGQRIKFGLKVDPINAEDATVKWSTGWISNPCISVDEYTGEVTANRVGTALLHINRYRIGPNGVYIQYPVRNSTDYIFDKFCISQNRFNHSFEFDSNEICTMNIGCTSKIYYDNYYLPDGIEFEYKTTDNTVAIIENGLIKALAPGKCEIYAIVHNGNTDVKSINSIQIIVNDNSFYPVTQMDLELPDKIYQYQEYEISPFFNENASDKGFSITIDGQDYQNNNNKIRFNSPGKAIITIISNNNNEFKKQCFVNVLPNAPDHFECLTKRILIGETKNAFQLGLFLVFKNGYKKIIDEDDIVFDPFDFTNRAWTNQNGLIKNRTTIKAVKTGNINLSFTSKIDNEITGNFTIEASAYTEEQYISLSQGIGLLAITFVLMLSLFFSFFIPLKKRWAIYTIDIALSVLFLTLAAVLYGLTSWFITSCILSLVTLSAVIIISSIFKKKIPLNFLEDPIEIVYKTPNFNKDATSFYKIDI